MLNLLDTDESERRPFRERPEWSDITPIKQDESPRGVVRIAYSDAFIDAHDYVRAVMAKDERSERVLELTEEALRMNPANYSIWAYRREVLLTLGSNLAVEHDLTEKLLLDHPKNYQLWYHLQWLMEQAAKEDSSSDPRTVYNRPDSALYDQVKNELQLIEKLLEDDSKNYHAWQYRRWVVDNFGVPAKDEIKFTEDMLRQDALNNSAWNHRFYTILADGLTDVVFDREMNYAVTQLKAKSYNESACNYLLGLISPSSLETAKNGKLVHKRLLLVIEKIEDLSVSDRDGAGESPTIISLLVELYHQSLLHKLLGYSPAEETLEILTEAADSAKDLCDRLALELDRIRVNYWKYRREQLVNLLKQIQ